MRQSRIFWKKSPLSKYDPKTWFLDLFLNSFKMKVLMVHQHSVKTACLEKIWFSSYSQKMALGQWDFSILCQYFTNRLISDFDFGHVDRHEWKKQGSLTSFLKKEIYIYIIWENEPFWAQKLCILITLDPLENFLKNFAQWKGLICRWKWY